MLQLKQINARKDSSIQSMRFFKTYKAETAQEYVELNLR